MRGRRGGQDSERGREGERERSENDERGGRGRREGGSSSSLADVKGKTQQKPPFPVMRLHSFSPSGFQRAEQQLNYLKFVQRNALNYRNMKPLNMNIFHVQNADVDFS